jgi:hypothetical protein
MHPDSLIYRFYAMCNISVLGFYKFSSYQFLYPGMDSVAGHSVSLHGILDPVLYISGPLQFFKSCMVTVNFNGRVAALVLTPGKIYHNHLEQYDICNSHYLAGFNTISNLQKKKI